MVEIAGKYYYLNLNKIVKFFDYSEHSTSVEREILDNYDASTGKEPKLCSKTIRELTTTGNPQIDNIKYDLLKMLIGRFLEYDNGAKRISDPEDFPVGLQLAFNTLVQEGFLIEKIN